MGDDLNRWGEEYAARGLSHRPVSWVKHEAANAGNPFITQLIRLHGMAGYGCYWRLVELLSSTDAHAIPSQGEQGYRGFQFGLGFNSPDEFEAFVSTLIDLELVTVSESGRRGVPLVDKAAQAIGIAAYNGHKGGKAAAKNRQR